MSDYPINDKRNPNYVQHQLIDNYLKSHPAAPDQGNRTSERWSEAVLKHYWGDDWLDISADGKYPARERCTEEQIQELDALQRLLSQEAARLAREVIGENEDPDRFHVSHFVHETSCIPQLQLWAKDDLRAEQRRRLDALQGGTKG